MPCLNGRQQWSGLYYPGVITSHPTGTEDYSIRGKFRVPINFHIGNMILAAATNFTVDSVPPSVFGGDSWLITHGPRPLFGAAWEVHAQHLINDDTDPGCGGPCV